MQTHREAGAINTSRFILSIQLRKIERCILSVVEDLTVRRYWLARATAVTITFSLIITCPRLSFFWGDPQIDNIWPLLEWQSAHLFKPLVSNITDHAAKRNFRLFQPVLLYVTQQGWVFGLLVQVLLGILSIGLAISIVYRLTNDRITAVLAGFGFGQTLAGKIAFLDLGGKGDGFAVFFLLAALAARNAFLLALLCFLACYCDERAAVAMGLVLLFHSTSRDGRIRPDQRAVAVLFAVTLYVATRIWIGYRFGLITPIGGKSAVGLIPLFDNLAGIHVIIPQSLLGFWIPFVLSIVFLVFYGRWLTLFTYIIMPLCVIGVALSVYDADRSLVYLAPLMFIPFRWAWLQVHEARRMYLLAALICLVLPTNALVGVYKAPGAGGEYKEGNLLAVELVRAIRLAEGQITAAGPKPRE